LKKTRNLAIANRLRVSSAHKITTVNFHVRGVYHGEKIYWTPVVVAAAAASINFREDSFSRARNIWIPVLPLCPLAQISRGEGGSAGRNICDT